MTCATKSLVMHLQWTESSKEAADETFEINGVDQKPPSMLGRSISGRPVSGSISPVASRLARSVSSASAAGSMPLKRPSLNTSTTGSFSRSQNRLSVISLNSPTSPSSPSAVSASLMSSTIRYGRAVVLNAPPKLVAMVETPDVAVGAVDPRKRRVVTATRFSSRTGADRRIFISTHQDKAQTTGRDDNQSDIDSRTSSRSSNTTTSSATTVDLDTDVVALRGAWAAVGDGSNTSPKGLLGHLPAKFAGLATPEKNPMAMQLTHEEVVVGCADGTI